MRRSVSILFALVAWFATVVQFVLMMQNSTASPAETIIRFFSFFTILTNILVALYFTLQALNVKWIFKPGYLTALTLYILIVGLVYQVLLRHLWQPQGWQRLVDELLHSVTPVLTLIFWYFYEIKEKVKYAHIKGWLTYPLIYLVYILLRGNYSGFYPYPFVNVSDLGFTKVLINSAGLLFFFVLIASLLIGIGHSISKPKQFKA